MTELRGYQSAVIEQLRDKIRAGRRRLVCVAPTGAGKTVIASFMIRNAVANKWRCLFLAHRKELIDQTVAKLADLEIACGVLMASDSRRDDYHAVQVASVQTLARRLDRLPPADLIVVDECHHATSASYQKIVAAYPKAVVIGLTATPWRTDKQGLADIYEDFALAATPRELMSSGALVEADYFAYDAPDLHDVGTVAGEFNQKDLAVACNTNVLVGSVVREYTAHAHGRPAIVFPVNIEHSRRLADEFSQAGYSAAHIDCNTDKVTRTAAMNNFRAGALTILSSVGVLTEGFDAPTAQVCILARPTKSLSLHLQMLGRVLRPAPGKSRALVHDHSGNLLRHGFVDDERDYALTATPSRVIAAHTCPACFSVFRALKKGVCPNCGTLVALPEERAESSREDKLQVDGRRISMDEIRAMRATCRPDLTDRQLARAAAASVEERYAEHKRLVAVAQAKGFKPGFVAHQYRQVFGVWPVIRDRALYDATAAADRPFFSLPKREAA